MRKVLLIGTGNIAKTHAAAIQEIPGLCLYGVFDSNPGAAESFAAQFGAAAVFRSIDEAAASAAEAVHVLTPPDTHFAAALPFIDAGKAVLLEKPAGVSSKECEAMRRAAHNSGAIIGVNQNLVFNPAYLKLRQAVASGSLGRPRYVNYLYEAPLRQLSARQFGHWMFRQPQNILLEQAVHPLSQIVDLAGRVLEVESLAEAPIEISPGVGLHNACQVSMRCEHMPAYLHFNVGAAFTVCRMMVVCDDGVAVADVFANQFHTLERGAYMEPIDGWLSARKTARSIVNAGFAVLRDYSLSMIKLKPRSDAFFLGMKGSISAFHGALGAQRKPRIDIDFGAHLVHVCERIAGSFKALPVAPPSSAPPMAELDPSGPLVVVIGGTGFIGSYTVEALLKQGYRVRVMARGTANLQAVYYRRGVEVGRGDVKRRDDIERCVKGADYVINLAHGGGGTSFAAIRAAMVDTAREVAAACRVAGIQRLVHVGSISGLFLGDAGTVIDGATPPDPLAHTRNDYARAKALADAEILLGHGQLPIVLLRPGLVIGRGTSPFHGGLGFFNNDQYCIGWNDGRNALPWVLADDCADAIVAALTAISAPGRAYNLVGDVRPSAREYMDSLATALGRPLHFVPSSPTGLWLTEMGKWVIKRAAGQKVSRPYRRDLLSRGLNATFDCADAKRDLGWKPVADPAEFRRRAIEVHATDC